MSNQFHADPASFAALKNKVVVLTGGASGIGAALIHHLHSAGAFITFSDLNTTLATSLLSSLSNPPSITFLPLDASSYIDTITLFRTALQKYGEVDHAIACAGVLEQGSWFDDALTVEALEREEAVGGRAPSRACVDVNLVGSAYFVRVAAVYLRHGRVEGADKSITLMSSAAGFRESPGLPMYQASKHGVLGLMRSIRKILYARDGIRLNAVCPGVTDTAMAAHVALAFRGASLGVNTADDVATMTLTLLTTVGDKIVGKAVYVEQGLGWEIEDGLWETMPQWLGEEPTERLRAGLRFVGAGDAWKK